MKGIAFDIIFQNKDATESLFVTEIAKHQNITLATQYHRDFCTIAYVALYNGISNTLGNREKYSKYVTPESCPSELQRIYSENKDTLSDTVRSLQKWSILESTIEPETLSDIDKLELYCPPSDGVYICPGLPRSIYA